MGVVCLQQGSIKMSFWDVMMAQLYTAVLGGAYLCQSSQSSTPKKTNSISYELN